VPFLLTSLGINQFSALQEISHSPPPVGGLSGVVLIILGAMIFTNQFTRLAGYFSF